jgi:putative membrane protein
MADWPAIDLQQSASAEGKSRMRFILRLLVTAVAVWVAVMLVPGLDFTGSIWSLLIISLIFGLINAFIRPIVLFLSCPLVAMTLGLFVLVVNAAMFWLTIWLSKQWDLGLTSEGLIATFLGALVISIVSGLLSLFLPDD